MSDRLPTVDELIKQAKSGGWDKVPQKAVAMAEELAIPALAVRKQASHMYVDGDVGYYLNPVEQEAGIYVPDGDKQAFALCKAAASRVANTRSSPLTLDELGTGKWVKVAYSKPLRAAGEIGNFFPGQSGVTGIPNAPSPLAAMLTTGLIGGGLGYGAGWLGEKLLPEKWKKGRLRKTLGILGGSVGPALGGAWIYANVKNNRPWNSNYYLNSPSPDNRFEGVDHGLPDTDVASPIKHAIDAYCAKMSADIEGEVKEAFESGTGLSAYQLDEPPRPTSLDVDINAMGETLWDVGAKPEEAAMTMGALHAAKQFPGGRDASWVTPGQMAQLGAHMGVGYVSGGLVGSALGALTGLPQGYQNRLKQTGAFMGIINNVVPKLFGGQ